MAGARDVIVCCPVLWSPSPWFRVIFTGSGMVLPAVRCDLRDELSVILWCHFGQLSYKGHYRPKLVITVIPPRWHTGHSDSVLDDPEQFRRGVMLG